MVPLASRTGQWYHVGLGLFLEERGQEEACWMPQGQKSEKTLSVKEEPEGESRDITPFRTPSASFRPSQGKYERSPLN